MVHVERAPAFADQRAAPERASALAVVLGDDANLLQSVIDACPDPMVVSDERLGRVVMVNAAYCELLRTDLEHEFLTWRLEDRVRRRPLRTPDGRRIPSTQTPLARALRGEVLCGPDALHVYMTALDGSELELSVTAAPIRDALGCITGAVVCARDVRGQRATEADLKDLLGERAALLKRVVLAHEEERRRMAHEVHDSLTQLATAAALRLDDLVERLAGVLPREDADDLERTRDLARATAQEARRLIAGLRPEVLDDFGLSGALRQEVDALRAEEWPAAFEDATCAEMRLAPEVEITLYRVAQEALSNVRKHAGRSRVQVRLRSIAGSLRLDVRDWGRGFDPAVLQRGAGGEHVGITSMHERMALLGGRLEVRSGPDRGTTVRATLPWPQT